MAMTPELIAIIGCAVALAGVILNTQRMTNESLREFRTETNESIQELRESLQELRQDVGELRERMARLEGLFEGFTRAPAAGHLTRA